MSLAIGSFRLENWRLSRDIYQTQKDLIVLNLTLKLAQDELTQFTQGWYHRLGKSNAISEIESKYGSKPISRQIDFLVAFTRFLNMSEQRERLATTVQHLCTQARGRCDLIQTQISYLNGNVEFMKEELRNLHSKHTLTKYTEDDLSQHVDRNYSNTYTVEL